jgi:hypothetical protein
VSDAEDANTIANLERMKDAFYSFGVCAFLLTDDETTTTLLSHHYFPTFMTMGIARNGLLASFPTPAIYP